jgi:hypothetical protein
MRKLLNHLPVACILVLYIAAHFTPVVDYWGHVNYGWRIASNLMVYLCYTFPARLAEGSLGGVDCWLFVGSLSNPLICLGIGALFFNNRRAGIIAEVAGSAAWVCALPTLPIHPQLLTPTPLAGFYLWMASIVLLTLTGVWKATRPNGVAPTGDQGPGGAGTS